MIPMSSGLEANLLKVAGCLVIIAFQYHPFDAVQRIEYKMGFIHLRLQGPTVSPQPAVR